MLSDARVRLLAPCRGRKPGCRARTLTLVRLSKRLRWRLLILAALVLAVAAARQYYLRGGRLPASSVQADAPCPSLTSRIVVFAPHCDDETLGAGGLIQQAVAAGARLRVVLMTNGDGFTLAAERQYHKLWVRPADYLRFARLRQRETLAALRLLGVLPERVSFLGYPDRGLLPIWQHYWDADHPYCSPYTRDCASPYPNSLTPGTPYWAGAVVADITRILQEENPTLILLPHPNDNHPDHWATYALVTYSLAGMETRSFGLLNRPEIYTYLVHRGYSFPAPRGYRPGLPLLPPAALARMDTCWLELPLTPLQVHLKYQATLCYRSQMRLVGGYLAGFSRANELFGLVKESIIPLEGQTVNAHRLLFQDTARDALLRDVQPSADLVRMLAWCSSDTLWLQLTARAQPRRGITYKVWLHSVPGGNPLCCEASVGQPPKWTFPNPHYHLHPPPVSAVFDDNGLWLRVPLHALGYPEAVMVAAEAWRLHLLVDRTATTLAYLPWARSRPATPWSADLPLRAAPGPAPAHPLATWARDFPPCP